MKWIVTMKPLRRPKGAQVAGGVHIERVECQEKIQAGVLAQQQAVKSGIRGYAVTNIAESKCL